MTIVGGDEQPNSQRQPVVICGVWAPLFLLNLALTISLFFLCHDFIFPSIVLPAFHVLGFRLTLIKLKRDRLHTVQSQRF